MTRIIKLANNRYMNESRPNISCTKFEINVKDAPN